jgi:hypothetical protein
VLEGQVWRCKGNIGPKGAVSAVEWVESRKQGLIEKLGEVKQNRQKRIKALTRATFASVNPYHIFPSSNHYYTLKMEVGN